MSAVLPFPRQPKPELTRCLQCGSFYCGPVACSFSKLRHEEQIPPLPACPYQRDTFCGCGRRGLCLECA